MTRIKTAFTGAALAAALTAPTPASAFAEATVEGCEEDLCLADGGNGKWKPDTRMSKKEKRKYRRRRGETSSLSLDVEGGRGTVFLDGRFLGVAPLSSVEIKPGPHDLQVRDGENVLAQGVLVASKKGGDLEATVTGG